MKKLTVKLISLTLVFALILSSCSKETESSKRTKRSIRDSKTELTDEEDDITSEDPTSEPDSETETTDTTPPAETSNGPYVDKMEDYWGDSDDLADLPADAHTKSEPLSFSPCDGIHINAKENQLYEDTVISFTPLTDETDPKVVKALEVLEEEDLYTLAAWEVDAGLKPDETFPGKYHVSIDLEYLDLSPELYDSLQVFRIGDDETYYECSTELDGNILHYSSNQNSVILLCIGLGASICITYYNEQKQRNLYYYNSGKDVCYLDGKTDYGKYRLEWLMKDADPELNKKFKQATKIENEKKAEAEKYAEQFDSFSAYRKNAIIAERFKQLLAEDDEYQKLAKEIKETNWPFPESIKFCESAIKDAYNYLGSLGFKMPLYRVEFKARSSMGNLGEAVTRALSSTYIQFAIDTILDGDKSQKDDLRLTLTHELFHVCQNRYRTYFVDSSRFDEMVALILEEDALAYYREKGLIDTAKIDLTPRGHWGALHLPIDNDPTSSCPDPGTVMQNEGYTLADFVDYLREKVNKNVTAKTLMDSRSYFKTPNTSDPLMAAFKLTQKQIDTYYHDFILSNRKKIASCVADEARKQEYNFPRIVGLVNDDKEHMDLCFEGSNSLTMRCFNQMNKDPLPLLVIPDDKTTVKRSNVHIIPAEEYTETKTGYYIPALKEYDANTKFRCVLEIYGDVTNDKKDLDKGYTVWGMAQIGQPKFAYDKKKNVIQVTFPEKSKAGEAGVIDGYLLTIKTSLGKEHKEYYPKTEFDKKQLIDVSLLRSGDDVGKDLKLEVTLCEYVKGKKDEILLGVPSKVYKYTLKGEAYDKCDVTISYKGEENHYHIEGGRFEGLKFEGDSYNGAQGYTWCLAHIKRGEGFSISVSSNTTCNYSTSVTGYNRDVSSSTKLFSAEGMSSFSIDSIPDDIYYVEVSFWNRDENRGVQISFEVVDQYTTSGMPEFVCNH